MSEHRLVPVEVLDRFPEINPSNYSHDDACALNAWGVELVLAAAPAPEQQVEQEPVGEIVYEFEPHRPGGRVYADLDGSKAALLKPGTKLYAGPQPVGQQVEQEPVSWQFFQDGRWWNGDDRIRGHRKNTEEAGFPVRDLYATPPAAPEMRIVFDGPPGPESGRFVEVEDALGRSINAGEWVKREDGFWELRINAETPAAPNVSGLVNALEEIAATWHNSQSCGQYFADVARQALSAHRGQEKDHE